MRHSKSRFIGVGIPLSQGESAYLFLEFTIIQKPVTTYGKIIGGFYEICSIPI